MPEGKRPLLKKSGEHADKILTVSELTANIKNLLEDNFTAVWVSGEVSNLRLPASGHCYFTLKDQGAQIAAVIWRSTLARVKFDLKDGMQMVVRGSLTVYEPRGNYQIIVEKLEPLGVGALELAFRQLKERLEKEGLFDPARKKPIPFLPHRIGIVTSLTGAAIRDILNVIDRRFSNVEIILAPTKVQGEGAAEEIAAAINYLNFLDRGLLTGVARMPVDVMIVGRGGGSLEDLWAFNEEIVARAIFASHVPVISAVGHEIDFTIADFVADLRALTPTEAGERVVPRKDLLLEQMDSMRSSLAGALRNALALQRRRLDSIAGSYAFRLPYERIRREEQRLDEISARLFSAASLVLSGSREKIAGVAGRLDNLSPLKTLSRGYSVTSRAADGAKPMTDAATVAEGDDIETRLHRGRLQSRVTRVVRETE
jgi:exodeoxyribonuclease VII large subunit